jgi:hypothetical protein
VVFANIKGRPGSRKTLASLEHGTITSIKMALDRDRQVDKSFLITWLKLSFMMEVLRLDIVEHRQGRNTAAHPNVSL